MGSTVVKQKEEDASNFDGLSFLIASIIYPIVLLVGLLNTTPDGEKWWLVALIAICGHAFVSVQKIEPSEWGALLFLGRARKQLRDGPIFAFWPFFEVKREARTVFQVIAGTALTDKEGRPIADNVTSDEFTILTEREPFRVNFLAIEALPTEVELQGLPADSLPPELALPKVTPDMVKRFKGDPLHGPITCDPQLVFWFDIKDYLSYLKRVHDVKTLSRNITGIAKAVLQECAGRMTVGMLITHNELVCKRITYRIERLIGEPLKQIPGKENPNWGVNFQTIQISSPGLPRTVNVSLSQNTAAGYDKQKTITLSEGEKQKRINEGFADAEKEKMMREAQAIGAQKLADVANQAGGLSVLQLEAMKEAVRTGNVTILPMDLAAFGSLVSTARGLLGNSGTPPANQPPPRKP